MDSFGPFAVEARMKRGVCVGFASGSEGRFGGRPESLQKTVCLVLIFLKRVDRLLPCRRRFVVMAREKSE